MNNRGNLAENIDAAKRHVLFHHDPSNTKGWITLAKKDPQTHKFYQYHYKPEELAEHLSQWTDEDVYYSQNTFYKPQRRIDNIRQLRTLYVDLDVYNLGMEPKWVLGKLELEYFGQSIPEPNMVIFSGRGLVLIWNITPIPYMAMPLWRAVENFFAQSLVEVGADTKATDPARIFRLPGTINSKNNATVTAQYRHDYRYDIHDLQVEYLPELSQAPEKAKQKAKPKRQSNVLRLFNIYTMNLTRALDIAKLVEIRNGNVNGHREVICFLYRYFTCCCSGDTERALEETLDLNSEFTEPLPVKEVISATKSAEKAWEAKSNAKADAAAKAAGYPGAGYNISNKKLIEWLDISPEEQQHLSIIIGVKEKNRRKRVQYQKDKEIILKQKEDKRRAEGVKSRGEYLSEAERKRAEIRQALIENPTLSVRALAEKTGYSKSSIQRVKTEL